MNSIADSRTKLHRVWSGMKERCYYKRHKSYSYYGGRGIRVCKKWFHSFIAFKEWSKANGYKEGLKLDRMDNDGPYKPSNCRFVTHKKNMNNTRRNQWITAFGETKTASEWSRDPRCKTTRRTLARRIQKFGWESEMALTAIVGVGGKRPKS